jgi:hypothetical protein
MRPRIVRPKAKSKIERGSVMTTGSRLPDESARTPKTGGTVRYLGVEVDDALAISEQVEL